MDTTIELVEAYLQVNGYFTVTEYPVLEALTAGGECAATDLDVLAIRFPEAGYLVAREDNLKLDRKNIFKTDPKLAVPKDQLDMIIGAVGASQNRSVKAALDETVLRAALARFGCCTQPQAEGVVDRLLEQGEVTTAAGHRARLVHFGMPSAQSVLPMARFVSLSRVVGFVREYLNQHWMELRRVRFKHPSINVLALMEKLAWGEALHIDDGE
jgi:hypothetical protein